jgi:hypothetical protein
MVLSSIHSDAGNGARLSPNISGAPQGSSRRHRYQLDLITPGNLPWDAMLLKQMRQMPNLRR